MEEGYEGIIVRNARAPYVRRRTGNLLKLKPMQHDTFKIIGYKKELTRVCIICKMTPSYCSCVVIGETPELVDIPIDTLGAIECITVDGKDFSVGSGTALTDATRAHFWQIRHLLIGKRALVKFQNYSDRGIPIHGVLIEISGLD